MTLVRPADWATSTKRENGGSSADAGASEEALRDSNAAVRTPGADCKSRRRDHLRKDLGVDVKVIGLEFPSIGSDRPFPTGVINRLQDESTSAMKTHQRGCCSRLKVHMIGLGPTSGGHGAECGSASACESCLAWVLFGSTASACFTASFASCHFDSLARVAARFIQAAT